MNLLKMSPSPHEKDLDNTSLVMGRVLIALLPALVWAVINFGLRSLSLTLVSVASCIITEFLFCRLAKMPVRVRDLSAAVTGVLLAFNLPVSAPLWMPALGGIFAIAVVKMLFGGLGKNIVNPALAARVFLLSSWTGNMTAFTAPQTLLSATDVSVDAVSSATALVSLKSGEFPDLSVIDCLLGKTGGCIGEVSALLLLAGGVYLLASKVITWHIPVSYLGTVALITFLLPHGTEAFNLSYMLYHLLSGGLVLGAVFMATDYATSPLTGTGKLIYGAGCGLITVFIRYFGGYPEGVSFAILIMNLLVWYIDKATKPRPFGGARK